FLAMNTASITLIPATIIAVRISLNSQNPQEIIATSIFASVCATTVAIIAARVLEKLPVFKKELEIEPKSTIEEPEK
ncbi:MAG: spore maturation protein, partial [bacterium]